MLSEARISEIQAIKNGEKVLPQYFSDLCDWVFEMYGVRPVYTYIENDEESWLPNGKSLELVFEYEKDKKQYLGDRSFGKNTLDYFLKKLFKQEYGLDKPAYAGVSTDSFDTLEKTKAMRELLNSETEELKACVEEYNIWDILTFFGHATIFLETEKEVQEAKSLNKLEEWKELFKTRLKKYDTHEYFKDDDSFLALDSKENFDKNYNSNWYYYFK